MSEYLCQYNNNIKEKFDILAVKNRMVDIPANFSINLNGLNMAN